MFGRKLKKTERMTIEEFNEKTAILLRRKMETETETEREWEPEIKDLEIERENKKIAEIFKKKNQEAIKTSIDKVNAFFNYNDLVNPKREITDAASHKTYSQTLPKVKARFGKTGR